MKEFVVGFTGTRTGLTEPQLKALRQWLESHPPTEVHHGNCVGADEQFAKAVVDMAPLNAELPYEVAHPTTFTKLQIRNGWADEYRTPLPPLERNKKIVAAVDVLVAGPSGPETLRSGTWATVRACRKAGKPVVIVWPNGTITEENAPTEARNGR